MHRWRLPESPSLACSTSHTALLGFTIPNPPYDHIIASTGHEKQWGRGRWGKNRWLRNVLWPPTSHLSDQPMGASTSIDDPFCQLSYILCDSDFLLLSSQCSVPSPVREMEFDSEAEGKRSWCFGRSHTSDDLGLIPQQHLDLLLLSMQIAAVALGLGRYINCK